MNQTPENLPTWDLSDLYEGPDDPRIEEELLAARQQALAFEEQWRGRLAKEDLQAEDLRQALEQYEALQRLAVLPQSYASLLFSTDTTDPRRGALVQRTRELASSIATHLIFFDLEIGRIPEATWTGLIRAPELAAYRHYLDHERELAAHYLSEPEEKVLEETANCRGRAFRRLFTELTSRLKYPLEKEGQTRELTQSELLALLYDPDREVRRQASEVLGQTLERHAHPLHFTFNTLLLEHQVMDRLRGFSRPEASRNLDNEIPDQAVDTMVDVVVSNYDLVARYYRLKRNLLGLEDLWHYDRYRPPSLRAGGRLVRRGPRNRVGGLPGLLTPLRGAGPPLLREGLDRRGSGPGQAGRGLLRRGDARQAPLRPDELHGKAARRDDAGPRAGARVA